MLWFLYTTADYIFFSQIVSVPIEKDNLTYDQICQFLQNKIIPLSKKPNTYFHSQANRIYVF